MNASAEVRLLTAGAMLAMGRRTEHDNIVGGMLAYAGARLDKHPGATGGMTQHALRVAAWYVLNEQRFLRNAMRSAAGTPAYTELKARVRANSEILSGVDTSSEITAP